MKKRIIDIIFIVILAIVLVVLIYGNVLSIQTKYMLVPLLAIYFLGQYVERKFH